ncbi:MAG TPA: ribbon-helix-helix domain-containing protein [Alphaproteobacteria bacterium]
MSLEKRSVVIDGHRTSVSLEPEFWRALRTVAERRGQSVNALVAEIDRARDGNLSSAIRVFVLAEIAGPRRA